MMMMTVMLMAWWLKAVVVPWRMCHWCKTDDNAGNLGSRHCTRFFLHFTDNKMKKLSGSSGRSLLLLITNITLMVLGAIGVASGSILIAVFHLHLFTFASQVSNLPRHIYVIAAAFLYQGSNMANFVAFCSGASAPHHFRNLNNNRCNIWTQPIQKEEWKKVKKILILDMTS